VQDGIIVIDRQMRYRVWSPVMERLSGMPAADVLGKTPMELFPFLREVGLLAMLERAMTGEIISSPDFPYDVPQTGRKGWSWQLMGPLRSAQGKIIGVITTVRDITQRKEFQQALLEANEFNNQIISNVQDGIIVMDLQLRYRVWSPGMERMRGLMAAEVLGKTPMELFPFLQEAGVVDMLERARAGETISTPDFAYEVPQTGRKGWNWGIMGPLRSADGQITGVIVTVRDITDRIQMQELAIQSEKMLSIGGLAAGMAHELNNPLAVMVQNAEVILQRISKDSPQNRVGAELAGTSLQAIQAYMNDREILQMLQGIHRSGERAANIVKSMLAFSRPRSATISTHRLDELIDQAIELMHSDYELMKRYHQSRVEMIREFDDTLGPVPCHGSEVQQVLLNLFSNAVHACAAVLPDAATPRIVVRTLRETNHATITVEDNGIGMPESVRRRVFEPFFTTKSPGEGTGLGLFLSYFIITHHHSGTMRVNPNPAGGTCFEISLPLDARKPAPLELKQN
jgi:PAS domain S-box-containing protein